jgi:diguanylate cyclase (GGDEF)-like protein
MVMEAVVPQEEPARLAALYAMDLLDQGPNPCFDRITRLAAHAFGVPIALVSLVDADRQWFGSRVGLDASETPRCDAFCAHAILEPDLFVIEDARSDTRFFDNPLVLGPPGIRFYAGAPIAAPSGHRLGTLCIIDQQPRSLELAERGALRDMADLVERELSVIDVALTDELTGLGNRRSFVQSGSQLVALADRRNEPISLLFADLDGLKAVNDGSGHALGDQLIRSAAAALRQSVRSSDLVARIGGDEFVVLMYGNDIEGARVVVDHIQEVLREHNATHPEAPALSMSLGVVQAVSGESIDGLMMRGDEAMYRVKKASRDRSRLPLDGR